MFTLHETNPHMIQSVPDQVDADADMALKARLSCPDACDLRGSMVRIIGQDAAVVKEIELIGFDGTVNETDELGLAKMSWGVEPFRRKEPAEASTPTCLSHTQMNLW